MEDKKDGSQFEIMALGGFGILMFVNTWDLFLAWLDQPKHLFLLVSFCLMIISLLVIFYWEIIMTNREKRKIEKSVLEQTNDSVFCGITNEKKEVWIKPHQRAMHTQIVGTTNAGKTESVILPWAIQDIFNGKGLILIDGKADNSLLDKLWSYTVSSGREKDFRLISLSHLEKSHQFNPLLGGSAEEITERVFNSFEFENAYYRSLQYEVMGQVMRIFEQSKEIPTFQRLHQVISNPGFLEKLCDKTDDDELKAWVQYYKSLTDSERDTRTSGLLAAISHFSHGKTSVVFNTGLDAVTIDEALDKNLIVYFQLPVLLSPFLGKATGKLVLQSLQSGIANRHRSQVLDKKFFSVFLDDFAEYLYPGFVSILNKSRSANVGIIFAHQALGDLTVLGDSVANSILTNSNIKIFMRGNDPDSAEYFSKVIGTVSTIKYTERQKRKLMTNDKTGDLSAREVEEFVVHPNSFKREIGVGEALMIIPHANGTKTVKIKFNKLDDLPKVLLPKIKHKLLPGLNLKIKSDDLKANEENYGKTIFINQEAA